MSILLGIAIVVMILAAAAIGWLIAQHAGRPESEKLSWWVIAPAPHNFFTAPAPAKVLRDRLIDGLYGVPDAREDTPILLVLDQAIASGAQSALINTGRQTVVGIPERLNARMRSTATGAGVLAFPATVSPQEVERAQPAPVVFEVHRLPGWFLGLDDVGIPVELQLIPGSTIAVHGGADLLLDQLPSQCPWVEVIRGDVPMEKPLLQAWREHWSASTTRIVVTSSDPQEATGLYPDVIVDARGEVTHRGQVTGFTQVQVGTDYSVRTALVSDALSAS